MNVHTAVSDASGGATEPPPPRPTVGDESTVVALAQAGDREAFDWLYERYHARISTFVARMMGSAEDASDLTQDAFLKAYVNLTDPRSRAHRDPELYVGSWLYRIATNVCRDALRHRKVVKWQPWESFLSVFHVAQVAPDSPERDALDREDAAEVRAILDRMHPRYRLFLELREYHGLSYDEMAAALRVSRATVKSVLLRARDQFRGLCARTPRPPGRTLEPAEAAAIAAREAPPIAGAEVRRRREAVGVSQWKFALRMHCHQTSLSELETLNRGGNGLRRRALAALEAAERERAPAAVA